MSKRIELQNNPRLKKVLEERFEIIRAIREFFWQQKFVEVETPMALRYAGQEPFLSPAEVNITDAEKKPYELRLRTSPEYSLKKLLAAGYEKIFELGKCFRDGEATSGTHSPEFTMLEWYRAPGTLEEIMNDTEKLFRFVLRRLKKTKLQYRGNEISALGVWEKVSVKKLFKQYLKANLDECLDLESLRKLSEEKGYKVAKDDEYEDVFYRLFLNEIEGKLGIERPIFIYDYPIQLCSLSRRSKDKRYGERFELYIGGLEVANAFGELVDPKEQERRLERDRQHRVKLGRKTWPVDPEFISALAELDKKGTQAGGIALGVDRMVVLCTGAKDINEVLFESIKDQFTNT
jgi:lysyl-tRNA synthetase class 2